MVKQHQAGLRGFICSLGVAFDWVDDIAQEAFVLAYQKQAEFIEGGNFGAWLRTIARNLVLNEATKRQRRQRLLDARVVELLVETASPESLSPDEEIFLAEQRTHRVQALSQCLQNLTDRARKVIHARYQNNLTSEEIGQRCAMSASAVRKVLFHSRHTLARCIERQLSETS